MEEGGHCSVECSSKLMGMMGVDSHGEEGGFVIIDGQASGLFKELKGVLDLHNSFTGTFKDNQSVIGVLKDGTRFIGD